MKTSVLIITYNQERYVAQALDSALMQRTREPFEIVVGEDCSTDRTREILVGYREQHPDRIRLLLRGKNLGMNRNFAETLSACRGEYAAILEGDDYWTSADKLQRQADFLDAHAECAAVFHNVRVTHEGTSGKDHLLHAKGKLKAFHSLEDIVSAHFIPTCSTMFRIGLFGVFPDWFYDMPMGDWPLHVLNAEHGSYGYMDEVMACYRVHGQGAWSMATRPEVLHRSILAAEAINRHLGFAYDATLRGLVDRWRKEALYLRSLEEGRADAARCLTGYLRTVPFLGKKYRRAVRNFLKSRFATR